MREFKDQILAMKKKLDEENFDEAVEQAYKIRQTTTVSSRSPFLSRTVD